MAVPPRRAVLVMFDSLRLRLILCVLVFVLLEQLLHFVNRSLRSEGRSPIFRLNLVVNFFAVDRNAARCFNADFYLVPTHIDDRNFDIVPDDNALVSLPSEY